MDVRHAKLLEGFAFDNLEAEWMRQLKLIVLILVLLMIGVIVMQNLETVKMNLLLASLEMPLAALLVCTLLVGYGLGLLTTALWKVRTWRTQALAARQLAASNKQAAATNSHSRRVERDPLLVSRSDRDTTSDMGVRAD